MYLLDHIRVYKYRDHDVINVLHNIFCNRYITNLANSLKINRRKNFCPHKFAKINPREIFRTAKFGKISHCKIFVVPNSRKYILAIFLHLAKQIY